MHNAINCARTCEWRTKAAGPPPTAVLACNLCTSNSGSSGSPATPGTPGTQLNSPQPVLLHAGLVRGRRWAVLELRIEQSVRCSATATAGPPATPSKVHTGAQADSQAALAARRRHSPGGATYSHQNDANSCNEREKNPKMRGGNGLNFRARVRLTPPSAPSRLSI